MKKALKFAKAQIMGVINCTPDSYYSESRNTSLKSALDLVERMLLEGADIIDVGAMSSRPGAEIIDDSDEWLRLKEVLFGIRKAYPDLFISVDTFHSSVAEKALDLGVDMVNDISAGSIDPKILDTVSKYDAYYCLMHMQNSPATMQVAPNYENVTKDIFTFLKVMLEKLSLNGIHKVLIDPGLGFGKSIDHNYQLLKNLEVFQILDKPILVGLSRKSMITKLLDIQPEDSLAATTALHLYALQKGANILRVHDVLEAKQAIALYSQLAL